MTINAINNIVNISGNPVFNASNSSIYGGYINPSSSATGTLTTDAFTGNTLNFSARPISIVNMGGFEYYNFEIPASAVNGSALITASGTVDVDGAKVEVKGIAAGSPLFVGDQVVLIDASTLSGTATTINSTVTQGISLIYDVNVAQSGNQMTATIISMALNPQTKALSEGRIAGLTFTTQGADLVADQGMVSAVSSATQAEGGLAAFGAMAGSSARYKSGSHVDVDGFSILSGVAYKRADVVIAGFIEGGWGSYDSYNSFNTAANVHGKGDTNYYGVGLLGRYDFSDALSNGLYVDGSLRVGQTDTDFKSRDLISASGTTAHYDSKSTYYSAHIGTGYVWSLNNTTRLDAAIKYLWTHQDSDHVTVAGDPIHFASADSHRVRLNGRLYHDMSTQLTLMGGLGYEYELDGDVKATTYRHYNIEAPSLGGGSGIGELGIAFTPSKNQNLSLEGKLSGYVGQREGVRGTVQLHYAF